MGHLIKAHSHSMVKVMSKSLLHDSNDLQRKKKKKLAQYNAIHSNNQSIQNKEYVMYS